MLAAILLVAAADGRTLTPLDLGTIPVVEARKLDGRAVLVLVTAEVPPYTHSGNAVVGFDPDEDGTERTATIFGSAEDHDIRIGDRLRVTGRLAVIDHPPSVINGVRFVGFTEVRVTGHLSVP